jgi:NTP pyrophosphatase (non-canonical NTP hydrolase)
MQIKEYSEKAKVTLADLGNHNLDNFHMVLGMVTEVGELADVYKKNLAYNKDIDLVNVKEEAGDIFWYLANFCTINGFDIEEILDTNIKKLEARYPDKFSKDKAINRNLGAERKILEGNNIDNTFGDRDLELPEPSKPDITKYNGVDMSYWKAKYE